MYYEVVSTYCLQYTRSRKNTTLLCTLKHFLIVSSAGRPHKFVKSIFLYVFLFLICSRVFWAIFKGLKHARFLQKWGFSIIMMYQPCPAGAWFELHAHAQCPADTRYRHLSLPGSSSHPRGIFYLLLQADLQLQMK